MSHIELNPKTALIERTTSEGAIKLFGETIEVMDKKIELTDNSNNFLNHKKVISLK